MMCEVSLSHTYTHSHTHLCALLHKLPCAGFTVSHRGGWGVDENPKGSLNCLCRRVADCVCVGLHRGSRTCLTRCSPLTPPRSRSTTPAPSRLSKVSHVHRLSQDASVTQKLREKASMPWITISLGSPYQLCQFTLYSLAACISSFLQAVRKPISMIWRSHTTYRYEHRNALINKMHAYHSTTGLTFPEGPRSKETNTPESQIFFPPSAFLYICLPLFSPPFRVSFFVPPSKRVWNSIELVLDGAWKRDWFGEKDYLQSVRLPHRPRKDEIKRRDESQRGFGKIHG